MMLSTVTGKQFTFLLPNVYGIYIIHYPFFAPVVIRICVIVGIICLKKNIIPVIVLIICRIVETPTSKGIRGKAIRIFRRGIFPRYWYRFN